MNTPFSSRMSTWDIPHVPPEPEAPPAETVARPSPASGDGDSRSPRAGRPEAPVPMVPEPSDAAQVRFLNAVTEGGGNLRIAAGNRLLSSSLSPEGLSEYFTLPAGFRPFAFYDAENPWTLLFRSTLPLTAGDVLTLAVVRSGGGLDLVRVDDRPCGVRGAGFSCLRCVDLIHDSPGLDLILTDGRVVFTDVRFKEVTNYRRAQPGRYDLYTAQTPSPVRPDIETVEELPMVVVRWAAEPLASFDWAAQAGRQATVYLMGDWSGNRALQVKIAENF